MQIRPALALIGLLSASAGADIIDLTTQNSFGVVNGARFETQDFRSAGTGVIQPVVRIQKNGTEQGYNTSGRPTAFDENTSPNFTRNLQLFEVPVITIEGTGYYEFLLDINQMSSSPLLSLDQVRLFTTPSGSLTVNNLGAVATLRYDLDAGVDSWIKLDYSLGTGSGQGDMRMFIPVSALGNAQQTDFVYLYSQFGTNLATNDGFEEWAVRSAVPAPSAVIPLLLGAAIARRRRR